MIRERNDFDLYHAVGSVSSARMNVWRQCIMV